MPAPMVSVALSLGLGVALADIAGFGWMGAAGLGAAAVAAWALARWSGRGTGMSTLGLVAAAGALLLVSERTGGRGPDAALEGRPVRLIGTVIGQPRAGANGTSVLVRVARIDGARGSRGDSLTVGVELPGAPLEPIVDGQWIAASGWLRRPRGLVNPGPSLAIDEAGRRGIDLVLRVRSSAALSALLLDPLWSPSRWLYSLRADWLGIVRRRLSGEGRALVEAMVLGERGAVPEDLERAFRDAGISHVLSVSGLHLAVVVFLFYRAGRWLTNRVGQGAQGGAVQALAPCAAMGVGAAYALLTGAEVATLRALWVSWAWFAADAVGRRMKGAQLLGVAAVVLIAGSPLELFSASLQLSLAASLAMVILAPPWTRWLVGCLGLGPGQAPRSIRPALLVRLGSAAAAICSASLAATVLTLPVVLWHFQRLSLVAPLTNLVAVPVAELALVPLGVISVVAAWLGLPGGDLGLGICAGLAEGVAWLARASAAAVPSFELAAPSPLEAWCWLLGTLALSARVQARRWAWLLPLAVVLFLARHELGRVRASVTLTCLDVGHGDACVLELPGPRVMVVDGGGLLGSSFDTGERVVAPFLLRRGIRRIDWLVLSHPHPDHAGGLAALVRTMPVGEIWTNGAESREHSVVALEAAARRAGVPIGRPHGLEHPGGDVRVLSPRDGTGAVAIDEGLEDNDNSIVLAIRHAGRVILMTGDIEAARERELVARGAVAAVDVVKVPHHGSRTSSTEEFVRAAAPRMALISTGAYNRWGFPDAEVLARYRRAGARVLRTDTSGAVTVRIGRYGDLETELRCPEGSACWHDPALGSE